LEEGTIPPPPVDNDFFDIAGQLDGHGTKRLAHDVLRSVWELYGKISGVSLEQYYRDVETREVIGKFAKSGNKPKDWRRRRDQLEELIRRVYIHTTCHMGTPPIRPKESQIHKAILKKLKSSDTVITFNYDLLIEESFDTGELWNPVDGYGVSVAGRTHNWCRVWVKNRSLTKFRPSEILLLKLHGSLNWTLYGNKKIRLKHFPYSVRTKDKKALFDKISVLPPGWNKRIDRVPYKDFWREARRRLESCNTLAIVGYSLPETDLLAQALIAEVVRKRRVNRNFLAQLHIADPSAVVKQKFIELFTPALGPLGTIFKYDGIQEFKEALG